MEEKEKCQGAEDFGPEVAGNGEEGLNNTLVIEVVRKEGEDGEEGSTMIAQMRETKVRRERE